MERLFEHDLNGLSAQLQVWRVSHQEIHSLEPLAIAGRRQQLARFLDRRLRIGLIAVAFGQLLRRGGPDGEGIVEPPDHGRHHIFDHVDQGVPVERQV